MMAIAWGFSLLWAEVDSASSRSGIETATHTKHCLPLSALWHIPSEKLRRFL